MVGAFVTDLGCAMGTYRVGAYALILVITSVVLLVTAMPAEAADSDAQNCGWQHRLTQTFGFLGKPQSAGCVRLKFKSDTAKDDQTDATLTVLGTLGATLTLQYAVREPSISADDALVLAFHAGDYASADGDAGREEVASSVTVTSSGGCTPRDVCTPSDVKFTRRDWSGTVVVDIGAQLRKLRPYQIWRFALTRKYAGGRSVSVEPMENTDVAIVIEQHPQFENDFGVSPAQTKAMKSAGTFATSRIGITFPITLDAHNGLTLAAGLLTTAGPDPSVFAQKFPGTKVPTPGGFTGANSQFFGLPKLSAGAPKPLRAALSNLGADAALFDLSKTISPDVGLKFVSASDALAKQSRDAGVLIYSGARGFDSTKAVSGSNIWDESATIALPLGSSTAATFNYTVDSRNTYEVDPINGPFSTPIPVSPGVTVQEPVKAVRYVHGSYVALDLVTSEAPHTFTLLRAGENTTAGAADTFISQLWSNKNLSGAVGYRYTGAAYNPRTSASNPLHGTGGPFYTAAWTHDWNGGDGEREMSASITQDVWSSATARQQYSTEADFTAPLWRNMSVAGTWVRSAATLDLITQEAVSYVTFPLSQGRLFDVNHGQLTVKWTTPALTVGGGLGTVDSAQCSLLTSALPGSPLPAGPTFTCLPPLNHGTYQALARIKTGVVVLDAYYGVENKGIETPVVTGRFERLVGLSVPFGECSFVRLTSINRSGYEVFSDQAGSSVDGMLQLGTSLSFRGHALAGQIRYHNGQSKDIFGGIVPGAAATGIDFRLATIDTTSDCAGAL